MDAAFLGDDQDVVMDLATARGLPAVWLPLRGVWIAQGRGAWVQSIVQASAGDLAEARRELERIPLAPPAVGVVSTGASTQDGPR